MKPERTTIKGFSGFGSVGGDRGAATVGGACSTSGSGWTSTAGCTAAFQGSRLLLKENQTTFSTLRNVCTSSMRRDSTKPAISSGTTRLVTSAVWVASRCSAKWNSGDFSAFNTCTTP